MVVAVVLGMTPRAECAGRGRETEKATLRSLARDRQRGGGCTCQLRGSRLLSLASAGPDSRQATAA